jgi:hypothetical protein
MQAHVDKVAEQCLGLCQDLPPSLATFLGRAGRDGIMAYEFVRHDLKLAITDVSGKRGRDRQVEPKPGSDDRITPRHDQIL